MGWATTFIAKLQLGETISFRPRGHSMSPRIHSGDRVIVEPNGENLSLRTGDIVLCKVKGAQYLHLVKAISGNRYQIGNNRGKINGWISLSSIYGKCILVEH